MKRIHLKNKKREGAGESWAVRTAFPNKSIKRGVLSLSPFSVLLKGKK